MIKADLVFTDPPYGYEYQSNMRTKSPYAKRDLQKYIARLKKEQRRTA